MAEPRRCVIGQRGHDDGALRALGLLLVVLAVTLVAASPAQAARVVTYRVRLADAAGHETSQAMAAVPSRPTPDTLAAGVDPTLMPALPVKKGMKGADILRSLRSDDEGDEGDEGDEEDEEDEANDDDDADDGDDVNPDETDHAGRRRARLLSPAPNATVRTRRPPLLRWMPVRRARYYNVQLFRGARKVLSAWPARPRYQIKKRWTRLGTPQRLRPGRYRWYVWPGFGARPKGHYGELLGRRAFTVTGRRHADA